MDKNLPQTTIPSTGFPFSIPKTFRLQSDLLLKNTDYLISAGGSTIHSKLPKNNLKLKALKRKKKGADIKIGGIGVSIGPFKSIEDEKAVERYLKSIDFLAVRDQTSFDYVSSLSLPYKPINAFDLAALLPDIYKFTIGSKEVNKVKTIGVSVCPYESIQNSMDLANEERRNKKTIELLKEINQKEHVHFKFFVINGNPKIGDYNLTQETIQKVAPNSYEVVEYSKDTQAIWKSLANCDFIISTRLHAAIFACFAHTPFMLNEYHRKCSDFLFNIDYHNSYRLYDSEYVIDEKVNQILTILNDRSKYVFPKKMAEMRELALSNFTEISL
jgi:polysaccharide pyruvyl transferase WcaK-like protein